MTEHEAFKAYVTASGVDFNTLSSEEKRRWRESFDRSKAPGSIGEKDEASERFLQEMRNAEVEGNKIELKSNWMFLDSPVLFVRDHYAGFYENQLNGLKMGGLFHRIVVSGTPGIGKSAFGLYCLYRAIHEGKTVVYYKLGHPPCVFGPDGAIVYKADKLPLHYMTNPNVVSIFDGMPPTATAGFTLLVTSPNRKIWHEFSKTSGARVLWFPMYSPEEMEALRKLAFNQAPREVSQQVMQDRIALFGCNPRHVLEKANVPRYDQRMLDSFINTFTDDALRNLNQRETGKNETSHMVVHINTEDYEDCQLSFTSNYVANKVIDTLATKSHDSLMNFFKSTSTNTAAGAIRGDIWARFVLDALEKGGNFDVRPLMPDPSGEREKAMTQLNIGPMKVLPMEKLPNDKDTSPEPNTMFHSSSYAGYDMYVPTPESKLINATINLNHEPIIAKKANAAMGIEETFKRCPPTTNKVPFIWAVPEDIYDKFQAKKIKFDGKATACDTKVGGRHLWQYAMKVPARRMSNFCHQALRVLSR